MVTPGTRAPSHHPAHPRALVVLPVLLCLLALAACHREFGTAPHGGPGSGSRGPALVNAIRSAAHPGFDRLVFDLQEFGGNGIPDYNVRYVPASSLRQDLPTGGSRLVTVQGAYFLTLDLGESSTTFGPFELTPNLREIKQVKVVGDLHGLVYGVGLARRNGFRVFALRNPSRIVLDVQNN